MDFTEKTLKRNYVYEGKILSLRVDEVLLCNGEKAKREIVDHTGGACVLYVENGKILFVRQFRYAYGEHVLEIPAGKLEKGEDPKTSALRELEEETGIKSSDATLLYVIYPTPGYTNEKIYIYRAKEGKQMQTCLDEGEFLRVEWIEKERVKKMLKEGEIVDGKTIIALQAYFMEE